jgi:hypothetical protein
MVFFLIPIIAALFTSGIGGLLTIFFGGLLITWLLGIFIKWAIVLGAIGLSLWYLYQSSMDKKLSQLKLGVAGALFIVGIAAYMQFFSNYVIIPGVFSFEGSMSTMSMETGQAITTSGWTLSPPLNYFILIVAGFAILSGIRTVRRRG